MAWIASCCGSGRSVPRVLTVRTHDQASASKEQSPQRSEKLTVQLHREDCHVLLLALTCGSFDGLKLVAAVLLRRSLDLCAGTSISLPSRGPSTGQEQTHLRLDRIKARFLRARLYIEHQSVSFLLRLRS